MGWTQKQFDAINTRDRTLLVSAAAGSGKTATLTERIIQSILDEKNPGDIGRMLIVTYTNAAVDELRTRVALKIREAADAAPDNAALEEQLLRIKDAKIMTITSFCNTILRSSAESIGLSPTYRIAEPSEAKIVSSAVLEGLINAAYEGVLDGVCTSQEFIALANALSNVKNSGSLADAISFLYDKLKSTEDGVATLGALIEEYDPKGFSSVEKTRLGDYICNFVRDAFMEYERLYISIAPLAGAEKMDKKNLELLDSDLGFVRSVCDSHGYTDMRDALSKYKAGRVSRPKPDNTTEFSERFAFIHDSLAADVKKLTAEYFSYTEGEWASTYAALYSTLSVLYRFMDEYDRRFADEKKRRSICEFSDVERYAYTALWENGERTELAHELAAKFDAIYVDEYQDVNALQNKIFEAISTDTNRFMVGDIKQSIYGFRAARPDIFADMKAHYPELGTPGDRPAASIFMSNNFRCDEPVIDFVNGVFDTLFSLKGQSIGYTDGDRLVFSKIYKEGEHPIGHVPEIHLIEKPSTSGAEGESEEEAVAREERESAELEAYYITKKIAEIIGKPLANGDPIMPKDITVLMRSVKGDLARELSTRLANVGIRTSVVDTGSLFLDESVLLALSFLYCIDNPRRDVYLAALMCSPLFGFTPDELLNIRRASESETLWEALSEFVAKNQSYERGVRFIASLIRYRRLSEGKRTDELLTMIYRESGLMALAARNGGRENLVLLHSYARKYEASDFKGLYSFISYINEIIESGEEFESASAEAEENAVKLMTVHKSKGLEFPVCILANTSSQGKPSKERITFSDTFGISLKLPDDTGLALVENPAGKIIDHYIKKGEYEEELRVLYVALTRAREMLYVYGTCKTAETDKYLNKVRNIGEANSPYLITQAKTFLDMILSARKCGRLTIENGTPKSLHIDPVKLPEKKAAAEVKKKKPVITASAEYEARFNFVNPRHHLETLPEKISVSRLAPGLLNESEEGEIDFSAYDLLVREGILPTEADGLKDIDGTESTDGEGETESRAYAPAFAVESTVPDSAARGIATHTVMQFCDFENLEKKGAKAELERLIEAGFIKAEDAALVRIDEICAFVRSELFAEMRRAKRLWREQRFNVKLPAVNFIEDNEKNTKRRAALMHEELLVQGVIDCVIEHEDGTLHLIDYKTDRTRRGKAGEEQLLSAHTRQLSYYAEAIRLMFGKSPDKVGIYSLQLGYEIPVSIDKS